MHKCLVAVVLICAFANNTAARATEVPISGDQVQLSVTLPTGVCLPDAKEIQRFERVTSAMDKTDLDLHIFLTCKNGRFTSPKDDYIMLQAKRSQTFNFVGRLFAMTTIDGRVKSQLPAIDKKAMDSQVNRKIKNKLGIDPGVDMTFGYLGRDDVCVYAGGRMSFDPKLQVTPGIVVNCFSAAAGREIAISRYNYAPTANFSDLMKQARTIMASIHQVN